MGGRRRIHGIQYVYYNNNLQLTSVYWLIKGNQQGFRRSLILRESFLLVINYYNWHVLFNLVLSNSKEGLILRIRVLEDYLLAQHNNKELTNF